MILIACTTWGLVLNRRGRTRGLSQGKIKAVGSLGGFLAYFGLLVFFSLALVDGVFFNTNQSGWVTTLFGLLVVGASIRCAVLATQWRRACAEATTEAADAV